MILKTLSMHKAILKLSQAYQITGTRQSWSGIKRPNVKKCTSNARSKTAIAYSKKAAIYVTILGSTLGKDHFGALIAKRLSLRAEILVVI